MCLSNAITQIDLSYSNGLSFSYIICLKGITNISEQLMKSLPVHSVYFKNLFSTSYPLQVNIIYLYILK